MSLRHQEGKGRHVPRGRRGCRRRAAGAAAVMLALPAVIAYRLIRGR